MGNILTEVQKLPPLLCPAFVDKTMTLEIVLGVADCLEENEWAPLGDVKPVKDAALPHVSEVKPDLQPVLELESKSQPDVLGTQCGVQTAHSASLQPMTQMPLPPQPQQPLQLPRVRSDTGGRFPTLPNTVPCMSGVERLEPEKLSWQSTFYRAASGIDTAKWSISPVRRDQNSGYCRGSQYVNLITSFV